MAGGQLAGHLAFLAKENYCYIAKDTPEKVARRATLSFWREDIEVIIICEDCGITKLDSQQGKLICPKCERSYQLRRVQLKLLSRRTKNLSTGEGNKTKGDVMEPVIYNAFEAGLTARPARRLDDRLWATDLGKNPYFMLRRLIFGELVEFDAATLAKMDAGTSLEHATLSKVSENLARPVIRDFPLFDERWTGYADFVAGHGTDEVLLADHKATGGQRWDYNESLPRSGDICQLWKYGKIYELTYGVTPELRLFYRGWGAWAEFVLTEHRRYAGKFPDVMLRADGWVTNKKGQNPQYLSRLRNINPYLLNHELEELHARVQIGDISALKEDMEQMKPDGPDWDYAERASVRLADELI